jgi:septum formation protein
MKLTLASTSDARISLLKAAHINFQAVPPNANEGPIMQNTQLSTSQKVSQLSALKAKSVYEIVQDLDQSDPTLWVVGGDTLFEIDGQIWGKPQDRDQAHERLKFMSGKTGAISSGLTLIHRNQTVTKISSAQVTMSQMSDSEIEAYLKTLEPMNAAGNFAIEGFGGPFIESISGDYFAIIGLSLNHLNQAIHEFGYSIIDFWH